MDGDPAAVSFRSRGRRRRERLGVAVPPDQICRRLVGEGGRPGDTTFDAN
jgi:hypothetical protein